MASTRLVIAFVATAATAELAFAACSGIGSGGGKTCNDLATCCAQTEDRT